jgi:hypothetical protein
MLVPQHRTATTTATAPPPPPQHHHHRHSTTTTATRTLITQATDGTGVYHRAGTEEVP